MSDLGSEFVNMADIAVDQQVQAGRGDWDALRFLARDGNCANLRYGELAERSSRMCELLRDQSVPASMAARSRARSPSPTSAGVDAAMAVAPPESNRPTSRTGPSSNWPWEA